jgi:serine/threonine protein kinase
MNLSKCLSSNRVKIEQIATEQGIDVTRHVDKESLCVALFGKEIATYSRTKCNTKISRSVLNIYAQSIGMDSSQYANKELLCEAIMNASPLRGVPVRLPFPLHDIPDTVCGYTLGNLLGEGTYGQVHNLSRDGQIYALKTESYDSGVIPSSTALTEAYIIAHSRHPHIVRGHDIFFECDGRSKGELHLVLDRANQGNMDEWLRTRKRKSKEKLDALFGILAGLAFLHSKNVIHCDLKPGNVIFNDNVAILADFGLSVRDVGDPKYSSVQSVYWRAPEIFDRDPYYTTKIDMWSVGALIWDLFDTSGTNLFQIPDDPALGDNAVLQRITELLKHPIQLPASPYKDALEDLMRQCLQINPLYRISAVQALQLPLFAGYEVPTGEWINPLPAQLGVDVENRKWMFELAEDLEFPEVTLITALDLAGRSPQNDGRMVGVASLIVADYILSPEQNTGLEMYLTLVEYTASEIIQAVAQLCTDLGFQLFPDQWVTTCKDPELRWEVIEDYIADKLPPDLESLYRTRQFAQLCTSKHI